MERLIRIQQGLRVNKDKSGDGGRFKYRSVEDVLENLKPLLADTNTAVVVTDALVEVCGKPAIKATAMLYATERGSCPIACADGYAFLDSHTVTGTTKDGQQYQKQTMSREQCTGSASSYARKYALCGLFAIDNGEEDPDRLELPEAKVTKPATKTQQSVSKQQSKTTAQPKAEKPVEAPKTTTTEEIDNDELTLYSNISSCETVQQVRMNVAMSIGKPYENNVRKAGALRGIDVAKNTEEINLAYALIQDKPGADEVKEYAIKVATQKGWYHEN